MLNVFRYSRFNYSLNIQAKRSNCQGLSDFFGESGPCEIRFHPNVAQEDEGSRSDTDNRLRRIKYFY